MLLLQARKLSYLGKQNTASPRAPTGKTAWLVKKKSKDKVRMPYKKTDIKDNIINNKGKNKENKQNNRGRVITHKTKYDLTVSIQSRTHVSLFKKNWNSIINSEFPNYSVT